MSTPFDVRRWAEQAGIHTTGGFSVVAECVTLDELQRFADIAIATAAKHWQRAHAIAALAMAERQEMSTPFNPEWLKPGAAVEVSMDNLAAYHAEVQRLMEENAALRAALAEPVQEPVAWRWGYRSVTTGEMDWRGYVEIAADPNLRSPAIIMEPLYTAPPQRKPLTKEEVPCPSCEYNKQRAQLWRHEAYKLGGHPLDWEPELMVRPKPPCATGDCIPSKCNICKVKE